jgi:pyruvate-ferredoxin/flavodoxin oxidoreductase
MAMAYGHVYVAQIAFGAKDVQTVKAIQEAESYPGPSLIIAYAPCIAHGYELGASLDHMGLAVECGAQILYRFDPRRTARGENPLQLDSKAPSIPFEEFAKTETRFKMLADSNPARAKELFAAAQKAIEARFEKYRKMAEGGAVVPERDSSPQKAQNSQNLCGGIDPLRSNQGR